MSFLRVLFYVLSVASLVVAILAVLGYPLLGSRWLTVAFAAAVLLSNIFVLGPKDPDLPDFRPPESDGRDDK